MKLTDLQSRRLTNNRLGMPSPRRFRTWWRLSTPPADSNPDVPYSPEDGQDHGANKVVSGHVSHHRIQIPQGRRPTIRPGSEVLRSKGRPPRRTAFPIRIESDTGRFKFHQPGSLPNTSIPFDVVRLQAAIDKINKANATREPVAPTNARVKTKFYETRSSEAGWNGQAAPSEGYLREEEDVIYRAIIAALR